MASNIQHVISNIELHNRLTEEIPAFVEANNVLSDLIKELDKKCEFTEMSKLIEDKRVHNQSHQHLDEMLEIARLPTTINTLIHKNDSNMAMKLINHFNENIYDDSSDLLREVKREIDILSNKIQQKLNIELEEGKAMSGEISLLLGDKPSEEALQSYFHKKYKIRMNLLKQRLQKALFSSSNQVDIRKSGPSEVMLYMDKVIQIFTDALKETHSTQEEEKLGFDNKVYHSLWTKTLIKEFTELILPLLEKLSKDPENIKYLLDLKSKLREIDITVYYLVEESLVNYIIGASIAYSQNLASKVNIYSKCPPCSLHTLNNLIL